MADAKAVLKAGYMENVEFTLSVTMTLEQWRGAQKTLAEGESRWGSWQLAAAIKSTVDQASKHFDAPIDIL